MKNKVFAAMMAAVMVLGMTACGSSEAKTPTNEAKASETQEETPAQSEAEAAAVEASQAEASQPAESGDAVELTVFAAASMTETLTEIAEMYKTVAPNVSLVFNFDSSGTLKEQIEQGAACDLFISAGQKQMNQLDITADPEVNTDGLDFVEQGTRINLLENKVVLVVPEDNPKNINSFDDMIAGLKDGSILLAMGNSDVPVGQYTQKILAYYELNEEELAKSGSITYGTNVKEVTTQVSEGAVDCGVIYCTDAFSAGLTVVDNATKEMCGQVIYPAAVLNVSTHKDEAQAFLDYLKTDEPMAVFEKVGFAAVE